MDKLRVAFLFWSAVLFTLPAAHAQIISTAVGNGLTTLTDGVQATATGLWFPMGLACDAGGNLFIADGHHYRIRKADPTGIISTVAGNGGISFSGDGGPATNCNFNGATQVEVDGAGNLFIDDLGNHRIRKVNASGIITTIAGNGGVGNSGDGVPATSVPVNGGMTADRQGNVYISGSGLIRKVHFSTGIITTVAGDGTGVYSGDGGPATAAGLSGDWIAVDKYGNIYISGSSVARVRKIDTAGIIHTIGGTGVWGYSGDGGPATDAQIGGQIEGVAVDLAGNLYLTDEQNQRVRKIDALGRITTITGDGSPGWTGDGGPATSAELNYISNIVKMGTGNIFISDRNNSRVRMITDTNHAVHFIGGHSLLLNVCTASFADTAHVSVSIDTLLAATDADVQQVVHWGVLSGPSHGTAFPVYSRYTTGGIVLPIGLLYSPAPGYTGYDTFLAVVTDGYTADTATVGVRIDNTMPDAGTIDGPDTLCVSDTIVLTDIAGGGVWLSSNTRATASGGNITGVMAGADTIIYSVTNGCGNAIARHAITIKDCPNETPGQAPLEPQGTLQAWPSPNRGTFSLLLRSPADEQIRVVITNEIGQKIKELTGWSNEAVPMNIGNRSGLYFISVISKSSVYQKNVMVSD